MNIGSPKRKLSSLSISANSSKSKRKRQNAADAADDRFEFIKHMFQQLIGVDGPQAGAADNSQAGATDGGSQAGATSDLGRPNTTAAMRFLGYIKECKERDDQWLSSDEVICVLRHLRKEEESSRFYNIVADQGDESMMRAWVKDLLDNQS
jgi:hypothetical protein